MCRSVLYHPSSPCVGALVQDSAGRVLLGKRGIEPLSGAWNLIGGFLHYGEDPFEGLRREVREELGMECRVGDFVAAVSDTYGPQGIALLNLHFRVRPCEGPGPVAQDDAAQLGWFPLDAVPQNLAFESDRKALSALRTIPPPAGAPGAPRPSG